MINLFVQNLYCKICQFHFLCHNLFGKILLSKNAAIVALSTYKFLHDTRHVYCFIVNWVKLPRFLNLTRQNIIVFFLQFLYNMSQFCSVIMINLCHCDNITARAELRIMWNKKILCFVSFKLILIRLIEYKDIFKRGLNVVLKN